MQLLPYARCPGITGTLSDQWRRDIVCPAMRLKNGMKIVFQANFIGSIKIKQQIARTCNRVSCNQRSCTRSIHLTLPLAGLEPAIPALGGRCLIHQATEAVRTNVIQSQDIPKIKRHHCCIINTKQISLTSAGSVAHFCNPATGELVVVDDLRLGLLLVALLR